MATKMPKITNTVFSGGGREEIAAPDVYKDTVAAESTISIFKSAVSAGKSMVTKLFKVDKFDASAVMRMINIDKGSIKLDKDSAVRQLEQASGYRFDGTSDIVEKVRNQAVLALDKYTNIDSNKLMSLTGDVIPLLSGNVNDARDLFGVVDDILGSDFLAQFPDFDGQKAFYGELLDAMIDMGVPNALDDLINKIDNDKMRQELLVKRVRYAATAGDLDMLYEIKGLIGAQNMYAQDPNIVKEVLAGYTVRHRKESEPTIDKQAVYDRMVTLFDEVDPTWAWTYRNGVKIGRTEAFARMSKDSREIFSSVGDYVPLAMFAKDFPSNDFQSIMRRDFKRIVLTNRNSAKAK